MEHHIRFDADAMTLYLLDQRALPGREDYLPIRTLDETIARVSNNISGLKLAFVNTINVLDIMNCDKFVVVKDAVSKIEEVYA